MSNNNIDTIISADKDFDHADTIQRIDPLDFEDWLIGQQLRTIKA